jgi:hypothetical protein
MALADQIENLIKKRTKSPTHCAYTVFYNNLSKEDQKSANESIYPVSVGKNFKFYLEYSKTNATFWNTLYSAF